MTRNTDELLSRLKAICSRKTPPEINGYVSVLNNAISVLENEPDTIREHVHSGEFAGKPGGIVSLHEDIPTIVVPDLHARTDFIMCLLAHKNGSGMTCLEMLREESIQIVCVGDGFHAEGRGAQRWRKAFDEFATLYRSHQNMDEEMKESLGLMEMVMLLKIGFPNHFHFLKGNHENIKNEKGGGNFPFRKYAYEGAMVLEYVKKFYGTGFLDLYSSFEKSLPLLAYGRNFIISHAEPRAFYDCDAIINYRENPQVVAGLTWTDNGESQEGSVGRMLAQFLGPDAARNGYYFGGHRIVDDLFNLRADGRFVQIHNPKKYIIAYMDPSAGFEPDRDIIELDPDGNSRCSTVKWQD